VKLLAFLKRVGLLPVEPGHLRSVGRLILLAGLVGVVAGLGAVAFQYLSHVVIRYGLEWVAGYKPTGPVGEWSIFESVRPLFGGFVPWLILAVITVGGLISGFIVYTLAPEAEGHGTDAAIKAYHRGRGIIRARVPLVKIICSAITIGTGGSGGREGPIAQIGAGFGSFLARLLGLSESERRMLLAAGLGAGIAAIFKAPLAGAIFAIEVLYRDEDFEAEALIPAFISCTVAYCVFALVSSYGFGVASGFQPLFAIQPDLKFNNPILLGPLTILAVGMVIASFVYVRCFYGVQGLFKRLKVVPHVKPAIGALATGLFALGLFYAMSFFGRGAQEDSLNVLSFGYGILQKMLSGQFQYGVTAAILLLLAVGLGKIVTTSLTISSGGSGGVFGPSMVIGGALGGAMGLALQQWMPTVVTRVDVFVILGMASFFSAAAKTPVSTIIMVSELTAGYELLLPAMWVSAIAYLLSRGWSIYREQVPSRFESPAHRGDFVIGVLKGLTVGQIFKASVRPVATVPAGTPLAKVMELIPTTTQTVFPVVDSQGDYQGLFSLNLIRRYLYENQFAGIVLAQEIASAEAEPLRLDTDLSTAMVQFAQLEYEELPVLESGVSRKVIGTLRRQEVLAAYNSRLAEMQAGKA
jgi:CIC family chloride channel protein